MSKRRRKKAQGNTHIDKGVSAGSSVRAVPNLKLWVSILFLAGTCYQLAAIREFSSSVFFGNPILDARYQIEWALALTQGTDLHPVFFQSPLYSYAMAGVLKIIGWNVWTLVSLQWLMTLATIVLFYLTQQSFLSLYV